VGGAFLPTLEVSVLFFSGKKIPDQSKKIVWYFGLNPVKDIKP